MNRSSLHWFSSAAMVGLVVTAFVAPSAQAAPSAASFCSDGSQPMVTQDEVVRTFDESTQVKGLTVVKGTKPIEFTGHYTGHLENALGKGVDMLLFELTGAGIDSGAHPAGIWAGMSGSPVYTQDGRLIGAVAYGLSPDSIPVAGITPADYMKKVGSARLASPAKVTITKQNLEGASARTASKLLGQAPQRLKAVKVVAGGSGVNASANRTLGRIPAVSTSARSVRAGGFAAVGTPTKMAEPLVPGGNIAVGYSTGDIFSGGVGTVTAICGSTVWAFGHPMDFMGDTSLSIHNASAALVVADSTGWNGSYKQVGAVGQQIGTITHDGFGAIRGQLGLIRGFPVKTTVKNSSGTVLDTYRGTVVDPWMAGSAALAPVMAAYDTLDNLGIGTARLTWRIDYRLRSGRTGSLTNSQVYASVGELSDSLATDFGNDVAALAYTDLADVTITSVSSVLTLLNTKAVDYRVAGAKVWTGKKWANLRGRTLKANRTYRVRPVYRQYVNGKPRGATTGAIVKFKLGKLARGRGQVTFAAQNGTSGENECIEIDGEVVCPEFGEDEGPKSFTALVAKLDALIARNRVAGQAEWAWKAGKAKGTSKRNFRGVAPGVVSGEFKATFRVRR